MKQKPGLGALYAIQSGNWESCCDKDMITDTVKPLILATLNFGVESM